MVRNRLRSLSRWLALAPLFAAGCGGGNSLPTGPSPVTSAVEFHYVLSGAPTASIAIDCVSRIHLHPSWWGFAPVNMVSVGSDDWAILFASVPIGRQSLRIQAPPECGIGEVSANGTTLTATEHVPGKSGTELGFTVHADGSVTP